MMQGGSACPGSGWSESGRPGTNRRFRQTCPSSADACWSAAASARPIRHWTRTAEPVSWGPVRSGWPAWSRLSSGRSRTGVEALDTNVEDQRLGKLPDGPWTTVEVDVEANVLRGPPWHDLGETLCRRSVRQGRARATN